MVPQSSQYTDEMITDLPNVVETDDEDLWRLTSAHVRHQSDELVAHLHPRESQHS